MDLETEEEVTKVKDWINNGLVAFFIHYNIIFIEGIFIFKGVLPVYISKGDIVLIVDLYC